MSTQNKLTDREWALVEDVSKEFGYWRRIPGRQSEEYPIKEKDLAGLIAVIARLSKPRQILSELQLHLLNAIRQEYDDLVLTGKYDFNVQQEQTRFLLNVVEDLMKEEPYNG